MYETQIAKMLEDVATGKVKSVKEGVNQLLIEADNIAGSDRRDLSPAEKAAELEDAINFHASLVPYVNSNWIDRIVDQIQRGAEVETLAAMAKRNRDDYAATARMDAGGDFNTWDVIYKGLTSGGGPPAQSPQPANPADATVPVG